MYVWICGFRWHLPAFKSFTKFESADVILSAASFISAMGLSIKAARRRRWDAIVVCAHILYMYMYIQVYAQNTCRLGDNKT